MYMNSIILYFLREVKGMLLNIHSFEVGGYKNIVNTKIKMDDVTAIVGVNGYGKSNVISAIEHGIKFIKAPIKSNLMDVFTNLPLLQGYQAMDYSFEIEAEYNGTMLKYGFSFEWKTDSNPKPSITEEHLLIWDSSAAKYRPVIKREEKTKAKYKPSVTGKCNKPINIKHNDLVINLLNISQPDLFFSKIVKVLNEFQFYVEKHLDTRKLYGLEHIRLNTEKGLDSKSNIPRVIYELKTEHNDKYAILIDTFKQIFPTVEWILPIKHDAIPQRPIDIPEDSNFVYTEYFYLLFVKDKNLVQPIRFDNLSDGTRRVFLALTFALLADILQYSTLVIEEPENSVHPSLLQTYIRQLNKLSGDCKIIFTSHSPYMVQYMPPENIYIGLQWPSGLVDFRKIVKSEALMKEAIENNQTVGELIFNYISFNNANEMLEEYLDMPSPKIKLERINDDDSDDWFDQLMSEDESEDEDGDTGAESSSSGQE